MYLGIDLGDKRCGVAVYVQGIVLPKAIILRPKLVSELRKLVKEYSVEELVVGLPYDLYGKKLRQLDKTKVFIEKLKNIFPDKKIVGIDERFTSFEADNILDTIGIKDKQGQKDDISAALILESYINKKKNTL
ncbi:Holliday junction resolvase RuvX [Candidatus Gracilibacteria bacterium 28_42_T64]|nr:Holliday junction resolvase RuvX [Candidatus Gracilibacteria bacterium 28_42_T64]